MPIALKSPPHPMTVTEFMDWDSGDGQSERWVLRDGVPEMMNPPSRRHGMIQAELAFLLIQHSRRRASPCRVVTAAGVIPKWRADINMLSPDITITLAPVGQEHAVPDPVAIIEILSPSNNTQTRANVRAFTSIPSLTEIVVLHWSRVAAEVMRRGADGAWPERPALLGSDDTLELTSIDFAAPLRDAYRDTGL